MTNIEKKLQSGTYKVSFDISIDKIDGLDTADIAHAVTSGFEDSTLLPKIANLEVKALEQNTFNSGETVRLLEDVEVQVNVKEEDGYFFVDPLKTEARDLGTTQIILKRGSQGQVSESASGEIHVMNIDTPVYLPLMDPETEDIIATQVVIDSVMIPQNILEKVEEDNEDAE